jgi:hypothetical protein
MACEELRRLCSIFSPVGVEYKKQARLRGHRSKPMIDAKDRPSRSLGFEDWTSHPTRSWTWFGPMHNLLCMLSPESFCALTVRLLLVIVIGIREVKLWYAWKALAETGLVPTGLGVG